MSRSFVAGVLALSVSARTREFGIRLAIGSQPRHLLGRVIAEGTAITAIGIGAGLACGLALPRATNAKAPKTMTFSRPPQSSASERSSDGQGRALSHLASG
jgi:ABC-type antimicrobial peptide transport system permease subunit